MIRFLCLVATSSMQKQLDTIIKIPLKKQCCGRNLFSEIILLLRHFCGKTFVWIRFSSLLVLISFLESSEIKENVVI